METGYIGHGKEFIPNFSAFGFGQATCCIFVFFFFLCMTSNVLFLGAHQVP